ncbi:unnamed protein product, partial [marine sediment metagenome]
ESFIENCRFYSDEDGIDGTGIDDSTCIWIRHNYMANIDVDGINITGTSGNEVFDVEISGNSFNTIGDDCVYFDYVDRCIINGNSFITSTSEGIYALNSDEGIVEGNQFRDNNYGVRLDTAVYWTISHNYFYSQDNSAILGPFTYAICIGNIMLEPGARGINATNSHYSIFIGNIIQDAVDAAVMTSGDYLVVSNNWFIDPTREGINFQGDYGLIIGNRFIGSTREDIDIGETLFTLIIGNHFSEGGGGFPTILIAGEDGVFIVSNFQNSATHRTHFVEATSSSNYLVIMGNFIRTNITGIEIVDSNNFFISGNYFYYNASNIIIDSGDDGAIVNNYFRQSTTAINLTAAAVTGCTVRGNIFDNVATPVVDSGNGTIFHDVTFYCSEADDEHGDVPGKSITNTQLAYVGFDIGDEVNQIMKAELHIIPDATQGAANWDLSATYAA